MITKEQKYSGSSEYKSLDLKLNMFYDICSRVNLPTKILNKAFLVILKGLA